MREYLKNNPERVLRQKKATKKWADKNKEPRKKYCEKWRSENKELCYQLKRNWRIKNKEKHNAHSKKYYEDNKIERLEYHKIHRKLNKDYYLNYEKIRSKLPSRKKKRNHYSVCRRARKLNAVGSHTFGDWELLKKQYGFKCPCCNGKEPEIILTEDHIIPLSKGGDNTIKNIQPLCTSCNCKKHTKIVKFKHIDLGFEN